MKKEIGNATLYLGKMEDIIPTLNSVDCIFSDPPYNYIKTHDFDRPFNEQLFFENAKRLLPDDGFIALFGRGTSFYRWNTRLADLRFIRRSQYGLIPRSFAPAERTSIMKDEQSNTQRT